MTKKDPERIEYVSTKFVITVIVDPLVFMECNKGHVTHLLHAFCKFPTYEMSVFCHTCVKNIRSCEKSGPCKKPESLSDPSDVR